MDVNYEKLVGIISKSSKLDREEIEKRVNAKRDRISGMISKEGAAQIVAAELGISFDNEKLKIDELMPGMRKVNLVGKVINFFPARTFTRNGQKGKVANLIVADETSNIRVVLWDTNHIELIETQKIKKGTVIEISNASMRDNELHVGSFCEIKISKEDIGEVKTEKIVKEKEIFEFKVSDDVSTRAFVIQIFEPKFFNVCMECKKKAVPEGDGFVCEQHGKTPGERRALMNLILDDGTETIRAVLFHEQLASFGFDNLDDRDFFEKKKTEVLGKEMSFSGAVRMNKFFNNPEFVISSANEINLDELIQKMEKTR